MSETAKNETLGTSYVPISMPGTSRADRNVPAASSAHCTAHAVLGAGSGHHVQAESWLELSALYVLNAMQNVASIQEQVRFFYGYDPKKLSQHVFDVVATLTDGTKIGFTVKPEVRLVSGRFLTEMQEVAWWAVEKAFVDEVRLVTERDIDKVDLRNAQTLAAVREADPEADALALSLISGLPEGVGQTLRRLTIDMGMQARGYRALIRLIREGMLCPIKRGLIGPELTVAQTEKPFRQMVDTDDSPTVTPEMIAA
ncbi:hypothetical protein [uncultured Roseobacter sp.]|uniref:hypothetical protein n=1 Tax=uncultured Roseobacter sp. TaxID=114847 RepID=UPI0026055F8D|nr:hypothetical protein [uncultured Roseobacter sp.]